MSVVQTYMFVILLYFGSHQVSVDEMADDPSWNQMLLSVHVDSFL